MVNKVILVGNLGQDPEIRYSQSGSKIANFSLATSDFWKDKSTGERKTITQWHRVVVFNENLANIVEQYIKKGSKIYIEGALQSRKYTASDGNEKHITEVVLSQFKGELQMLDSRKSTFENSVENQDTASPSKEYSSSENKNKNFPSVGEDLDDEIPF